MPRGPAQLIHRQPVPALVVPPAAPPAPDDHRHVDQVLVVLVAEEALAQLGQPVLSALQGAHELLPPVAEEDVVVGPLADEGLVVVEVLAGGPQAQVGVVVLARPGQLPVRAREQRVGPRAAPQVQHDGTIRPRASPGAAVRGLRDLLSLSRPTCHSFFTGPVLLGAAKSGVRSNGLCPQSVFAAGGVVPVGFKHSWLSTKSLFARESSATVVRMGTRVLETLDDMRDILSYDSIGCKQALPIFEELVKAGQEPAGEDYPATNLEHRLVEWLDRREAAPDTPPVKPQSPRQPIYLNLKRKASEESEPEPEKPEPQVTTFLLPRAAEPQDEDFMRNKAAPVFHSSNHVLVIPCYQYAVLQTCFLRSSRYDFVSMGHCTFATPLFAGCSDCISTRTLNWKRFA